MKIWATQKKTTSVMWTLGGIHSFAPQYVSTSCIARCSKDLA